MEKSEEQRRFAHQTRTVASPLHESGYGALVLERLAKQVCRVAGVEWSCIFVRDRRDPRSVIAAAGHGLPWDLLGTRIGADEGSLASVLSTGAPAHVDDYGDLVGAQDRTMTGCAAVALPIQWNGSVGGALSAAWTTAGDTFGEDELELLTELADLAAAALEHAD